MAKDDKDALTKHLETVTGKESEGATVEPEVAEVPEAAPEAPAPRPTGKGPVFTRDPKTGRLIAE